jgi:hypothetical protein
LLRNSAKRFRSSSSSSYPPLYVSRILASGLPPSADATNFHRLKSRTLAETSRSPEIKMEKTPTNVWTYQEHEEQWERAKFIRTLRCSQSMFLTGNVGTTGR